MELKEKREEVEYNKKMREMNIEQKLKEIERSETLFLLELRRKNNEIRLQEAQLENDQREKGAIYIEKNYNQYFCHVIKIMNVVNMT